MVHGLLGPRQHPLHFLVRKPPHTCRLCARTNLHPHALSVSSSASLAICQKQNTSLAGRSIAHSSKWSLHAALASDCCAKLEPGSAKGALLEASTLCSYWTLLVQQVQRRQILFTPFPNTCAQAPPLLPSDGISPQELPGASKTVNESSPKAKHAHKARMAHL